VKLSKLHSPLLYFLAFSYGTCETKEQVASVSRRLEVLTVACLTFVVFEMCRVKFVHVEVRW